MENIEIILTDISKKKVDQLIYEELGLPKLKAKSSHFYDNTTEKDLDFSQVKSLEKILSPQGTGNIMIEELPLGIVLKNVLVVFSFDEQIGDVLLNFPERELFTDEGESKNKLRLKKLVQYLVNLKSNYDIPIIRIGYEPATDEDSLLLEIDSSLSSYDEKIEKIFS